MKRAIATTLALVAMVQVAAGEKLLVLQSEGRADAKTRAKVDAAIVKLARSGTDQVTPGEITYTDAAALVGCMPEQAACRDEVIASLAVDAIVITTVNPKPGGLEITVKRAGKNGAAKDATTIVPADKPDQVGALGPVLGAKAVGPTPVGPTPVGPTPVGPTPVGPTEPPKDPVTPPVTPPADPTTTKPADPVVGQVGEGVTPTTPAKPLDQPAGSDDAREKRRNRYRIAGMAGGGGLVVLSFILWGAANGVEGDIDNFVVRSRADLEELRSLEDKGDSYANWGNLFFVGGLALGGASTYFYFKARKKKRAAAEKATAARITPLVFDGGGGISLTFGGAR